MIIDKNKFFAELEKLGEQTVRENIAQKFYRQEKVNLANEWLRQKESSRSKATLERQDECDLENLEIARKDNAEARSAKYAAWIAAMATMIAAIIAIISLYFRK